MRKAAHHSRAGHVAYLGGEISQHGWARYYLVTTALKEPLGLLVAAGLAVALAARRRREPAAREVLLLALLAGGVLLAASTGGVNIGHRYVLATEPLLALVVAGGARLAAAEPRTRARAAALAVFVAGSVATAASSLGAHPDALGYTNALAGRAPDRWLVDSNLDWGQDLDRLAAWLRERGVEGPVRVAYFGLARVERHVPGAVALAPRDVAPGWVAISVTKLREGEEADPAAYAWLLSLEPVARIGTSILVYRVTPEHAARLRAGG
jgi:hypothetical protein